MTNMSYLERSEKRAGTAFPKRESRRREEGEARAWLKEPILRLRCLPSTWDGSVAGVQTELLGDMIMDELPPKNPPHRFGMAVDEDKMTGKDGPNPALTSNRTKPSHTSRNNPTRLRLNTEFSYNRARVGSETALGPRCLLQDHTPFIGVGKRNYSQSRCTKQHSPVVQAPLGRASGQWCSCLPAGERLGLPVSLQTEAVLCETWERLGRVNVSWSPSSGYN
ncbi:uncharacterized protein LOC141579029 [Camelus bactrianus]|uniref:Uncharacterized protein LOC141579029 n=1 Tax=Camelus bactrianus TaxID=9837 RepID=A0AC58R483_CAMBA